MRMRLIALTCGSLIAAGCGTASVGPSAAGPASTAATVSAASAGATGSACSSGSAASVGSRTLTGVQFVSPAQGWAVGQNSILATSDGGARWTAQLTGDLNLTSVDFISAKDGWAVGASSLLATTDGGAHWTALPEPCPLVRSVHFISPTAGFAVAGGDNLGYSGGTVPSQRGTVLATSDGGHTWHAIATPANAQTVCFGDASDGWLGAGGYLYRTSDGGRDWTAVATKSSTLGAANLRSMDVQCAGSAAWALMLGAGSAMNQQPHVAYHADAAGATPIYAEQYFETPGGTPTADAPGSIAGPFSALSPSSAVFIDWCSACGYGTAPWDLASGSGSTLSRLGNVADITDPEAASFQSAHVGWVAGIEESFPASGVPRQQQRIVATTDAGKTWHVQYAGPWSAN
jgi:photosystem II stability/assembly factor-like uncharacterized protein